MSTRVEPTRALEREWWLRTIALVLRPQLAFEALRDEPEDAAPARSEPMLAVTWLAGIAAVLASSVAVNPLDSHVAGGILYQTDALVFTVWVFLAGGAYGFVAYWLVGGAL